MDIPEPNFTIDDLLAELQREDVAGGVTVRELCERSGLLPTQANVAKVRNKVTDLIALGKWEYTGKKNLRDVTGAPRPTPAYRPVSHE